MSKSPTGPHTRRLNEEQTAAQAKYDKWRAKCFIECVEGIDDNGKPFIAFVFCANPEDKIALRNGTKDLATFKKEGNIVSSRLTDTKPFTEQDDQNLQNYINHFLNNKYMKTLDYGKKR